MGLVQRNSEPKVIIDLSYFCYHTMNSTYKTFEYHFGKPDNIDTFDFSANVEYMAEFKRKFMFELNKLKDQTATTFKHVIFAKDCVRSNIWRKNYFPNYKIERDIKKSGYPNFRTVFNYVYNELIPSVTEKIGIKVVEYCVAEADDVIFVLKKLFREENPNRPIYIISYDKDYLQLVDERTYLMTVNGEIYNNKTVGSSKRDLMYKIIIGDKSDCIPAIFPKCGPKTGEKLLDNKELLLEKLKDDDVKKKFILNKKIIDFNEIPIEIQNKILEVYHSL